MSLRNRATEDLEVMLSDGPEVTVTAPDGTSATLRALTADVGTSIDPETGTAVVGRQASVSLHMRALRREGLGTPRGISDESAKPWLVTFGDETTWKVIEAKPDRAVGLVTCMLEGWSDG